MKERRVVAMVKPRSKQTDFLPKQKTDAMSISKPAKNKRQVKGLVNHG